MSTNGKNKIIEAAKNVISQNGITGATVRSIADEAGLSTGAIYHHYQTKNDILYDIMDQSLSVSTRIAEASVEGKVSKEDLIKDIYENVIDRFHKSDENRLQFYLAHEVIIGNKELQIKFKEKYNEWISRVEDILVNLYGSKKTPLNRAFATWLIAAVDGVVLQILLDSNPSDLEDIMTVFNLLLEEGIPQFVQYINKRSD